MGIGIPRRPVRRRGIGTPALSSPATALAPSRAAAEVASEQAAFAFAEREKEIKAQTRSKRLKAQTAIIQAANQVSAEFDAARNPDVDAYRASYSAAIQPILDGIDEEDIASTLIAFSERVQSDRARQLQFRANQFARDERVLVLKNNTEALEVQYGLCAIGSEGDACRDSTAANIEVDIGFASDQGDIKSGAGKALLLDSRVRQQNAYIQGFITESPRAALAALESGEDRFLQGMSRENFAKFKAKAQAAVKRLNDDATRLEREAQIIPNAKLVRDLVREIKAADMLSLDEIDVRLEELLEGGDIDGGQFLRLNAALDVQRSLVDERLQGLAGIFDAMGGGPILDPLEVGSPKFKKSLDLVYETVFEPRIADTSAGGSVPPALVAPKPVPFPEQQPGVLTLPTTGQPSVVPPAELEQDQVAAEVAHAMSMVGALAPKLISRIKEGVGSTRPEKFAEAARLYAAIRVQPNADVLTSVFDDRQQMLLNMYLTRAGNDQDPAQAVADVFAFKKRTPDEVKEIESRWVAESHGQEARDFLIDRLMIGEGFGPAQLEFGRALIPNKSVDEFEAHVRNLYVAAGGERGAYEAAVNTAMGDYVGRWGMSSTGTGGERTFVTNPPEIHYRVIGAPDGWHQEQLVEEVREALGDPDFPEDRIRIQADPLTAMETRPKYAVFILNEFGHPSPLQDPDTLQTRSFGPEWTTSPAFRRHLQRILDRTRQEPNDIANEMALRDYYAENPNNWFELTLKAQPFLNSINPFLNAVLGGRMEDGTPVPVDILSLKTQAMFKNLIGGGPGLGGPSVVRQRQRAVGIAPNFPIDVEGVDVEQMGLDLVERLSKSRPL